MHGRLKVKTTAEQQEEKRKERENKLKLFQKGCAAVNEKRNQKAYDKEALTLIGGLLQANPDFYTLWNFRKEIILHLKETNNEGYLQALCLEDMSLTEACLRKNPKSYGAWHHRLWIIKLIPEPNWKLEIGLCNKFLELDERNFHCWDHRRAVCRFADTSPSEELKFTMDKIEANFSNYSAWHYRSSLLPLVYPGDKEEFRSIEESKLLKEYELVQNAAFTDPSDQSAWFYHRWLLGRAQKTLEILYAYVSLSQSNVIVAFTKPFLLNEDCNIELQIDRKKINCHWENPQRNTYASSIWVCSGLPSEVREGSTLSLYFESPDSKDNLEFPAKKEVLKWKEETRKSLYSSELKFATEQVLKQELESCSQLMEMEPDNKWTILTCVLLMQALDNQCHESTVLGYLIKLTTLDPKRQNYYLDLRSKFIVENSIERLKEEQWSLDLANQGLTSVPHLDHLSMIKELNISGNSIKTLKQFSALVCLQTLDANDNQISHCSGLEGLSCLVHVSIKNNQISSMEALTCLATCKNLKTLNLDGNQIYKNQDSITEVRKSLVGINIASV